MFTTIRAGINQRLLIMKEDTGSLVIKNHPREAMMIVLPRVSIVVLKPFLICCFAKKSESAIMEMIANGCMRDIFGNPRLYFFTTTKKTIKDIVMRQ